MCSDAALCEPETARVPPAGAREVALACRNVGKVYQIYERPQDRLKQALLRWTGRRYYHDFWAVRNVSFEVERGESVAIVGRNGAGKSTLLQIIAGTMAPTHGEVEVRGRVAAMLQLGSGFNPEFTGRENVYLSGAVLGISRAEMQARFDDVAAFADIGEFLDQPLKTYSSGMQARLAFAVSFSVDPDILIADEVLAVGDIGFQQRCVARLRQMRDRGLTLLLVTHSPDAVRSICRRALLMDHGQAVFFGGADAAVNQYLAFVREETNREALEADAGESLRPVPFAADVPGKLRYGTGQVQFERVRVLDASGEPRRAFAFGDEIVVEALVRAHAPARHLNMSFLLRDITGVDLMGTTTFDEHAELPALAPGDTLTVRFRFENRLRAGNYGVCMAVNRVSRRDYADVVLFDQVDGCAAFAVMPDPSRPVHYKFHQPVTVEHAREGGA
ncbi:MAG: ABC transporter ATP-binding protein [Planctomycetota bacterium]|nr:ABC transporter ATP-binding protein [Planctomycetota bacterium]